VLTLTGFQTLPGLFRPDPIINGYKKTGMLPISFRDRLHFEEGDNIVFEIKDDFCLNNSQFFDLLINFSLTSCIAPDFSFFVTL
jgi:hypothetical protein